MTAARIVCGRDMARSAQMKMSHNMSVPTSTPSPLFRTILALKASTYLRASMYLH